MAVSKITRSIRAIWSRFSEKDYRDDFVADTIDDGLAVQIHSLREKRGWTQSDLASKLGTKQSGVCRWEAGDSPPTLTTLKKLASAFDVALVVKFVPYSEFLQGDGKPIDRHVSSFAEDGLKETRPRIHSVCIYGNRAVDISTRVEEPLESLGHSMAFDEISPPVRINSIQAVSTWVN